MKNQNSVKKGFTLIELLVVVSIIAILMAAGLVSFQTAQKSGRDARRKGDLKGIQNAFEQYFLASGTYPASCNGVLTPTPQLLPGGYPTDPKSGLAYNAITPAPSCLTTDYCFCVYLEQGSGNSGVSCDFDAATKNYFCVGNRQ